MEQADVGQSNERELNQDTNVFTDKKSGKQFRRFKYFDIEVIQDVETGWINAGKFIKEIGRLTKKDIKMKDFKRTEDFQFCLEYMQTQGGGDISSTLKDEVSYKLSSGYGNDVKGSYTVFRVFQLIALWADKKHKLAILELLEQINIQANILNVSAYEVMNKENERLKSENEILRKSNETLNEQHEKDKALISSFNRPYNKTEQTSGIYAISVNEDYAWLRYDRGFGKKDTLFYYKIHNARDAKDELMKELERRSLIERIDGKRLVLKSNISLIQNIIKEIVEGSTYVAPSKEERNLFIDNKLMEFRRKPKTVQNEGMIYEYEYIRSHENLIPWKFIPRTILFDKNEQRREKGIDAVELTKDGQIQAIVQIKHHHNTYLRIEEIQTFMEKVNDTRYKNVQKILVLHDCRLSNKLKRQIELNGIEIEMN